MTDTPLIEIRDLRVVFHGDDGRTTHAVDAVDLSVANGATLGLVGESGCGKSVTSLAIMGLLPKHSAEVTGSIRFDGFDLLDVPDQTLRDLRGNRLAMIFQEPMTSLNPSFTIGEQIIETILRHRGGSRRAARERAIELLRRVHIPSPERRIDEYPHKLSGGMRQRVMIAMALACDPRLLIADEPTTALDVTMQAQILDLMRELKAASGAAIILITHDLGVVAEVCDEVAVMYAGEIVERAPSMNCSPIPQHPYTVGLLGSIPRLDRRTSHLATIEGMVPNMANAAAPAAASPRAALSPARPASPRRRRWCDVSAGSLVALHQGAAGKAGVVMAVRSVLNVFRPSPQERLRVVGRVGAEGAGVGGGRRKEDPPTPDIESELRSPRTPPLRFATRGEGEDDRPARGRRSGQTFRRRPFGVRTADRVHQGGRWRQLQRRCRRDAGAGRRIRLRQVHRQPAGAAADRAGRRPHPLRGPRPPGAGRQRIARLPPRRADHLSGPLRLAQPAHDSQPDPDRAAGAARSRAAVAAVASASRNCCAWSGWSRALRAATRHEFSGGQRQRIAIARALAVEPKLIICDEPVSALDVSIRSQILNLLRDLQDRLGLAYIFVSHDLAVVKHIADRVAVMNLGNDRRDRGRRGAVRLAAPSL